MLPKPAIEQGECNPECHACNIRNPILHICAAPKGGLDELYETAKSACANKDWNEPNSASARQRKGHSGEGYEVHDFIAAIWTRRRLIDWPEHGHCQNSRHDDCKRDIEILAHANRVKALGIEYKEKLRFGRFAVKAKAVLNQRLGGSDKGR